MPHLSHLRALWLALATTMLLAGCLPEPRSEKQLADELADAQASATGDTASSSGGGTKTKCTSGDTSTVKEDFSSFFEMLGVCFTKEWVPGCSPNAKCVAECLEEQGTTPLCQVCSGQRMGPCAESKCKAPCAVGLPPLACQTCLSNSCGTALKACLP